VEFARHRRDRTQEVTDDGWVEDPFDFQGSQERRRDEGAPSQMSKRQGSMLPCRLEVEVRVF
jgi:hypothetical protein